MNSQFDELTKNVAQSFTRRAALKKFGVGVVAVLAASLGIRRASAAPKTSGYCQVSATWEGKYTGNCIDPKTCQVVISTHCTGGRSGKLALIDDPCLGIGSYLDTSKKCSF